MDDGQFAKMNDAIIRLNFYTESQKDISFLLPIVSLSQNGWPMILGVVLGILLLFLLLLLLAVRRRRENEKRLPHKDIDEEHSLGLFEHPSLNEDKSYIDSQLSRISDSESSFGRKRENNDHDGTSVDLSVASSFPTVNYNTIVRINSNSQLDVLNSYVYDRNFSDFDARSDNRLTFSRAEPEISTRPKLTGSITGLMTASGVLRLNNVYSESDNRDNKHLSDIESRSIRSSKSVRGKRFAQDDGFYPSFYIESTEDGYSSEPLKNDGSRFGKRANSSILSSLHKRATIDPSGHDPTNIGVLRLNDERGYQSSDESPYMSSSIKSRTRKSSQLTRIARKKNQKEKLNSIETPDTISHEVTYRTLSLETDTRSNSIKAISCPMNEDAESNFPEDSGEIAPEKIIIDRFTQMISLKIESGGGQSDVSLFGHQEYAFPYEEAASILQNRKRTNRLDKLTQKSSDSYYLTSSIPSEVDEDSLSPESFTSINRSSRHPRK